MARFVQLHILTSYPPSNLNRDDTGRPKTALMGDANRLRISSQSLKRAWRTSEVFESALPPDHIGIRTKSMGKEVFKSLKDGGIGDKEAREWAKEIAKQFGKIKSDKKTDNDVDLEIEQLAHFSPEEQAAISSLVRTIIERRSAPTAEELGLLTRPRRAVDIAMFGRMLADNPDFNREAAVQVAHAITTHRVTVEDDFYTAVDDLKTAEEDAGAGFVGELGFGSGVFYLYACVDRALLVRNLGGDETLVATALGALMEAAATVSPRGKQPSFAARARAHYTLAEKGDAQPRTLAGAFARPVNGLDLVDASIAALTSWRARLDAAYGPCASASCEMNVVAGTGTLADLVAFCRAP